MTCSDYQKSGLCKIHQAFPFGSVGQNILHIPSIVIKHGLLEMSHQKQILQHIKTPFAVGFSHIFPFFAPCLIPKGYIHVVTSSSDFSAKRVSKGTRTPTLMQIWWH